MPRSSAGTSVTSSPSNKILPEVGCSKPEIIYSVVDLPQPDGPNNPVSAPSFYRQIDVIDRHGLTKILNQIH